MCEEFILIKTLQFYADKHGYYSNKMFSFKIANESEIISILAHFNLGGNKFRAIFLKEKFEVAGRFIASSKELILEYNFFEVMRNRVFSSKSEIYENYKLFKGGL